MEKKMNTRIVKFTFDFVEVGHLEKSQACKDFAIWTIRSTEKRRVYKIKADRLT